MMRDYQAGGPLVFTHIPKTVGTSLREAIKASLEPEVVFNGFGPAVLGSCSDLEAVHPLIRQQVALDPDELPADAEFVSGHIEPSLTRARFPDADHFTVLREPRVRLLSTWLFARAHSDFSLRGWKHLGDWMRAARSNLVDYITNPLVAPHVDNAIARLLLWPDERIPCEAFIDPAHDDELFEAAIEMLDTFAYVDTVEAPDWIVGLSDWLGRPLSLPRLQEVGSLPQPDSLDLRAEVARGAEELRRRTRIDARIWRHVAERTFAAAGIDEIAERVYRNAVARYARLAARPVKLPYRRRVVERSYEALTRLRA